MKFKSILDSVRNGTLFWYVYVSETAECNKEIPFLYKYWFMPHDSETLFLVFCFLQACWANLLFYTKNIFSS